MSNVSFEQNFSFITKTKQQNSVFVAWEKSFFHFCPEMQKAEVLISAAAVDSFIYLFFLSFPDLYCTYSP